MAHKTQVLPPSSLPAPLKRCQMPGRREPPCQMALAQEWRAAETPALAQQLASGWAERPERAAARASSSRGPEHRLSGRVRTATLSNAALTRSTSDDRGPPAPLRAVEDEPLCPGRSDETGVVALDGLPRLVRHARPIPPGLDGAARPLVAAPEGPVGQGGGMLVGAEGAVREKAVQGRESTGRFRARQDPQGTGGWAVSAPIPPAARASSVGPVRRHGKPIRRRHEEPIPPAQQGQQQ